jgi:hypothetical protein
LARARYEHFATGEAARAEAPARRLRAGLGGVDYERGRSGGVPARLCRCSITRGGIGIDRACPLGAGDAGMGGTAPSLARCRGRARHWKEPGLRRAYA